MSAWILLRGLTREARHWGSFASTLHRHARVAPIATIDLPGCGCRHRETSPASVQRIADACRAATRAQGLWPPYRLVALSLGSMVAMDWASRHPGEVSHAVLINTSSRDSAAWHRRMRPRHGVRLLGLLLSHDAERIERSILRLTSSRARSDADALIRDWVEWRRTAPVSRLNALRQLVAAMRFRAPECSPSARLLFLASARDALVDPISSQRLADRWRADIAFHPDAGHDLPLDEPDWVALQIARWHDADDLSSRRGNACDSATADR